MTIARVVLTLPYLTLEAAQSAATRFEEDFRIEPLAVTINEIDEAKNLWETMAYFTSEAEAKDADDALLINTNSEVAETASANLFWIYHDKICTTPTGRGALPGITRAVILEICQVLGLQTNKRVIKREALKNAESIFLSQSTLGLISIVNLDGEPVPESPLVEKIYTAYCEMLARE